MRGRLPDALPLAAADGAWETRRMRTALVLALLTTGCTEGFCRADLGYPSAPDTCSPAEVCVASTCEPAFEPHYVVTVDAVWFPIDRAGDAPSMVLDVEMDGVTLDTSEPLMPLFGGDTFLASDVGWASRAFVLREGATLAIHARDATSSSMYTSCSTEVTADVLRHASLSCGTCPSCVGAGTEHIIAAIRPIL